MTGFGRELLAAAGAGADPARLTHVADLPARPGRTADWPEWAPAPLIAALAARGIEKPWSHQCATAEAAHAGRHVVVATGTASGKSLGYLLPVLTALAAEPRACALYLSPTKALGADQLAGARGLAAAAAPDAGVAAYDGDTPAEARRVVRDAARWVFTNPDMLHLGILGHHERWARLLRGLRFVIVDECHAYRGVFGANVALTLRRLLRLARALGADPVVVAASATSADPGGHLAALIGEPAEAVTADGAPAGERTIALWEPAVVDAAGGEHGAPVRRGAGAEAAELMARLVAEGARTLTFARSRHGAESIALAVRERLAEAGRPDLAGRVEAYRAGYLAEERRGIEARLDSGELVGVAATNALELGIDVGGLDAVVQAGFPGTVASFRQQAGRAGRRGQGCLVVLIARDDPMDSYLVHHPEALLGRPVERTVFDPANPHVLRGHLYCAAAERPLTGEELAAWGAAEVAAAMVAEGSLRRRGGRWFPVDRPTREGGPELAGAHARVWLRGGGEAEVAIVDATDGRLLGTVDAARAKTQVHRGAVHLHRGESFVVDELDLDSGLALVHPERPAWSTFARSDTALRVLGTVEAVDLPGGAGARLCEVEVERRVTSYLRRLPGGEVLDTVPLDYPPEVLTTRAVAWTLREATLTRWGVDRERLPGALHAAEHAAIGMLPLVATCDRWDIGGVSTALHLDTGLPTVFVYDGHAGGAGFAERGYRALGRWLAATRDQVAGCPCETGCPACIQSPKCGNGNEPLDKAGALRVLDGLAGAAAAAGFGLEDGAADPAG
ncbi:Zn-binding domain-containing protein [Corynebacterium sphenisci]|uniref:Zn-binding domain-containing protein n=1 Tax=Corynebacterium sphenisci TaxID=191493 RepID=UPI000952A667|nr:DEAD/DEAH box helicase [Corynebacterium sphenisci]